MNKFDEQKTRNVLQEKMEKHKLIIEARIKRPSVIIQGISKEEFRRFLEIQNNKRRG